MSDDGFASGLPSAMISDSSGKAFLRFFLEVRIPQSFHFILPETPSSFLPTTVFAGKLTASLHVFSTSPPAPN